MINTLEKNLSEIEQLASILLSTLDEKIFFNELAKFFITTTEIENVSLYMVTEEKTAQLVSRGGEMIEEGDIIPKGFGLVGQVIRTRRAYFSNNIMKDPLFSAEGITTEQKELALPISHDGIVMATIHFRSDTHEFSKKDITFLVSILSDLQKPLANMRMYLAAKGLNKILLKKIEAKEKELEERKNGLQRNSLYRATEKEIIHNSKIMEEIISLSDRIAQTDW